MNCLICEKEIMNGEETKIHYGLIMHKSCEALYIDYDNKTNRDYAPCKCGTKVDIYCLIKQGKQVGIGRCKCGKVYLTFRFPANPRPRKIKAPIRYSDDEKKERGLI